jgi:hypothetical protein
MQADRCLYVSGNILRGRDVANEHNNDEPSPLALICMSAAPNCIPIFVDAGM